MNIINLTPHKIAIRTQNGDMVLEPSGQVARVTTTYEDAGTIAGIPAVRRALGTVEGLPEPQANVVYLVSSMVLEAAAAAGRQDVVAPDTGPTAIRDEQGRIVAVTRFVVAIPKRP